MIHIIDDYFTDKTYFDLKKYSEKEFKIIDVGEKQFSVLDTPAELVPVLQQKGYELVMTFIRSAHKEFDTDLRIHADNIIKNQRISLASVYYISGDEVSKNGTAFYDHNKYGHKLPSDISEDDFNKILIEDSNDSSQWTQRDLVTSRPNRMVFYDSSYFHSKFPSKIDRGVRKVMVCFYKKLK